MRKRVCGSLSGWIRSACWQPTPSVIADEIKEGLPRMRKLTTFSTVAIVAVLFVGVTNAQRAPYDLLVRNGRVVGGWDRQSLVPSRCRDPGRHDCAHCALHLGAGCPCS